jgi:hypothetical protein
LGGVMKQATLTSNLITENLFLEMSEYCFAYHFVLFQVSNSVFEMGPADSRAFGPALAGQAGPIIWKPALRGAGRAAYLKHENQGRNSLWDTVTSDYCP